jgi:hypothetical protein
MPLASAHVLGNRKVDLTLMTYSFPIVKPRVKPAKYTRFIIVFSRFNK